MATNANGKTARDVESNEATGLLDEMGTSLSPAESSVGTAEELLWQELEHPWPATFERSISLLASPTINPKEAEHFTKSPKPGNTPLAAIRYQRGNETPEGALLPPLSHRKSIDGRFQKGVQKIQSLDFKSTAANLKMDHNLTSIESAQMQQQLKAKEAAEYRARLLKEQRRAQPGGPEMSPGYGREKASMRHAKKMKDAQKEKELNFDAKATVLQCIFNLANILMGVGLLGLPFAFAAAGWAGASFAVASFSFVAWKTSVMIGRQLNGDPRPASYFNDSPYKTPLPPGSVPEARMRKPIHSFPDIARSAFGNTGAILLSAVLYFELFSCLSIFFVTMGDHMHTLFPTISQSMHATILAALSLIPIILLRTARLLSYLSMVGTFATVSVVLAVFAAALLEGDITEEVAKKVSVPENDGSFHELWKPTGLPLAFGLVAYCFSGHAIVPSIYSSMQNPSEFERVVDLSFLIVTGCCFLVGMSGYWMFGSLVHDQVTISLEQNSSAETAMTILTYLMVVTAFSKLVLTMFPLALGMEEIIAPYLGSDHAMELASSMIKFILTVLALIVAIFVPSFSFLCSLVGMICTMTVSVIFPAAAHLQLFGSRLSVGETITSWIFVITGTIMAIVGTILTV